MVLLACNQNSKANKNRKYPPWVKREHHDPALRQENEDNSVILDLHSNYPAPCCLFKERTAAQCKKKKKIA